MPAYFDSSFLLEGLLDQPEQEHLVALWDNEPTRVGSILLEAECVTVLRRAAAHQPLVERERFLSVRLDLLDQYLARVVLKNFDDEVAGRLRREPRLGACRALDAIHLATAILLQEQFDSPLIICSLDQQMRQVAVTLGFAVAPV